VLGLKNRNAKEFAVDLRRAHAR